MSSSASSTSPESSRPAGAAILAFGGAPRPARLAALVFAAALSLLLVASPASAGDDAAREQARQHFNRALSLVAEGEHLAAAAELRLAYQASPHYAVLYNLGQALVDGGRPAEAHAVLQRYLAEGGPQIEAGRRASVEAQLAAMAAGLGELVVQVVPEGADVRLDGEPLGGSTVLVSPGSHVLSVTAPGHLPQQRTLEASAGVQTPVTLALDPAPGTLRIACALAGVKIRIDGQPVGQTPLAGPLTLARGPHRLTFAHDHAGSAERQVTVGDDEIVEDCGLRPPPPPPPAADEGGDGGDGDTQRLVALALGGTGLAVGVAAVAVAAWNESRFVAWQDERRALEAAAAPPSAPESLLARARENDELLESIGVVDGVAVAMAIGAGTLLGAGGLLYFTAHESSEVAFVPVGSGGLVGWRTAW